MWRSNIAVDHRLPGGLVSTTEYLYAKDVNAVYYIDANLPAPQSAFTGVDPRPRVGRHRRVQVPASVGGCVTRINATPGNLVTNAYVLKNTDDGSQWSIAQSLNKAFGFGLSVRGAYSYGRVVQSVGSRIDGGDELLAQLALHQPEHAGSQLVDVVARPPRVRARQLPQGVAGHRHHRRVGLLGSTAEHQYRRRPASATSSPATPTATA